MPGARRCQNSMKLTAVFEHWHLGDGNYPPLSIGDEVCLSFEVNTHAIEPAPPDAPEAVEQLRDAEYEITARVIRSYGDGIGSRFAVFEAAWFRFYCPCQAAAALVAGDRVRLRGNVALDHYLWVEFLERYPDPPDLFYNLRVTRVRRIIIPDRFIRRGEKSLSYPVSLAPKHYEPAAHEDVQTVEESVEGPAFSLIDFELLPAGSDPKRPTFFGT